MNRLNREREQRQAGKKKELSDTRRMLDGLIDAIAGGLRSETLQAKLETFETRRRELEEELVAAAPPAPRCHPNLAELYRRKVERLQETLQDPEIRQEALEILRSLIEAITITPFEEGFEIELVGDLAIMIATAEAPKNQKRASFSSETARSIKVVAGVGFEPTTFRL